MAVTTLETSPMQRIMNLALKPAEHPHAWHGSFQVQIQKPRALQPIAQLPIKSYQP